MDASNPNRLREVREALDYSQQALADDSGVGRVTINRIEHDTQSPTVDVALRLARSLGVTLDRLFGDDRESPHAAYRRGHAAGMRQAVTRDERTARANEYQRGWGDGVRAERDNPSEATVWAVRQRIEADTAQEASR